MNELIKIQKSGKGNPVVNARELHEFLEVGKDFSTWLKSRIKKYGFVENVDFAPIYFDFNGKKMNLPKNGEQSPSDFKKVFKIEYAITLDCAKELSMVQNNEKGRQARQYFIQIEKEFRALKEVKEVKKITTHTMSETAKLLNLTDYFGKIGRNALFNILHHHKITDKKNRALPKYVQNGYFLNYPTRVTEEGLRWLNQRFVIEKTNNTEVQELQRLVAEMRENEKMLTEGITCIVETMLYNKGGNRTEEQNRKSIANLTNFLEKAKGQKALN